MNKLRYEGLPETVRYAADEWQGPNTGEQGKTYWLNTRTQERRYQPNKPESRGDGQQEQPQGQQGPTDEQTKAKAAGYAQKAREQFGDQAHEKLSAIAASLEGDASPEAQRKLGAVKAMLESLGAETPAQVATQEEETEEEDDGSEWEDDDGEDIRDKWDDIDDQVDTINGQSYAFDADDLAKWNEELERVGSDDRLVANDDGQRVWRVGKEMAAEIAGWKDFGPSRIGELNQKIADDNDNVKVSLASTDRPIFYDADESDPIWRENTVKTLQKLKQRVKSRGDIHTINDSLEEAGESDKLVYNGKYTAINEDGIDAESLNEINEFGINEAQGKDTTWANLFEINEKLESEGSGEWMLVPQYGAFKPIKSENAQEWFDDNAWTSWSIDEAPEADRPALAEKVNELAENYGSDVRLYPSADGKTYTAMNLEEDIIDVANQLEEQMGTENGAEDAAWLNSLLEQKGSDDRIFFGNYSESDDAAFYGLPEEEFNFVSKVEPTEDGVKKANAELEENGDDYRLLLRSGRIAIVGAESVKYSADSPGFRYKKGKPIKRRKARHEPIRMKTQRIYKVPAWASMRARYAKPDEPLRIETKQLLRQPWDYDA